MTRMRAKYEEEVRKALMEKFGYKSPMQIPKLDKIIINIGVGEAKDNANKIVNDALIKAQEVKKQQEDLNKIVFAYKKKLRNMLVQQLEEIEDIELL